MIKFVKNALIVMSQPPRKKFKQTTLLESFKRQLSTEKSSPKESEPEAEMDERLLRAAAAERRRYFTVSNSTNCCCIYLQKSTIYHLATEFSTGP